MKRIALVAALLAAAPIASAHACTERQSERLTARAEALFEQMNANGSPATGRAYMQAEEAIHRCSKEQVAGNNTPLSGAAFASAAEQYPHGYFKNHPIATSKWRDPAFGAVFEDCETAKQDDPSYGCSGSSEHVERHSGP
jgi:hypothetical protein